MPEGLRVRDKECLAKTCQMKVFRAPASTSGVQEPLAPSPEPKALAENAAHSSAAIAKWLCLASASKLAKLFYSNINIR